MVFKPLWAPLLLRAVVVQLVVTLSLPISEALAETTVVVAPPEKSRLIQEIQLTGTLTARYRAQLSPRVDGLVQEVMVEAGDMVEAGQPLLRLDSEMDQISLQQVESETVEAKARVNEALRRVNEVRSLVERKHISQSEMATRESTLAYARASLAASRAREKSYRTRIERHVLVAPFDGVIVDKKAEMGEWLSRGDAVFELVNPHEVWLDVQAPQEYFSSITDQLDVQIKPDALPGQLLTGRVSRTVPVTSNHSRTFLVRILATSQQGLLPGSSATAMIRVPVDTSDSLFVPSDALLQQPDGKYTVFSVEFDGSAAIARKRKVNIGQRGEGRVEILDGVSADELVVIRGNEILRDGDQVKVIRLKDDESI